MSNGIKRVHFFDHQFLHAEDFIAEQEYHKGMRWRHNRLLHTWGIADDGYQLEVAEDAPEGATGVNISAGTAYDQHGREVVLPQKTFQGLDNGLEDAASIYVTISYHEEKTDPTDESGVTGNTRWTERALVEVWPVGASGDLPDEVDNATKLILARVEREGTAITNIDLSERRYAGMLTAKLEVPSLTLSHDDFDPGQWPTLRCESPNRVDLTGDLRVTGNVCIGTPISEQPIGMIDIKTSTLPVVIRNYEVLPADAHVEKARCEALQAELPSDSLPCLVLWGVREDRAVAFYYFTKDGVYRALIQGQQVA